MNESQRKIYQKFTEVLELARTGTDHGKIIESFRTIVIDADTAEFFTGLTQNIGALVRGSLRESNLSDEQKSLIKERYNVSKLYDDNSDAYDEQRVVELFSSGIQYLKEQTDVENKNKSIVGVNVLERILVILEEVKNDIKEQAQFIERFEKGFLERAQNERKN